MKDFFHVDHFLHDLGLPNVSRITVQDQCVDVRLKLCASTAASIASRQSSHRTYRPELIDLCSNILGTLCRLSCACRWSGIRRRRRMVIPRYCAERFALSPFAIPGAPQKNKLVISHERNAVYTAGRWAAKRRIDRLAIGPRPSTFTRRPARSKRTLPSTSAKIV